mmetsp:Transcript_93550/g.296837  ORF Transcript_93550/g.296837 Transcript_93550/m.296837 type:complete len:321 (-) Transcript_93550:1049-2011(-)
MPSSQRRRRARRSSRMGSPSKPNAAQRKAAATAKPGSRGVAAAPAASRARRSWKAPRRDFCCCSFVRVQAESSRSERARAVRRRPQRPALAASTWCGRWPKAAWMRRPSKVADLACNARDCGSHSKSSTPSSTGACHPLRAPRSRRCRRFLISSSGSCSSSRRSGASRRGQMRRKARDSSARYFWIFVAARPQKARSTSSCVQPAASRPASTRSTSGAENEAERASDSRPRASHSSGLRAWASPKPHARRASCRGESVPTNLAVREASFPTSSCLSRAAAPRQGTMRAKSWPSSALGARSTASARAPASLWLRAPAWEKV